LSVAILCGIAHGQDPASALDGLVGDEAKKQLQATDPVLRGEAALIVAAEAEPTNHAAILAASRDPAPEAQVRGIVALGLQASPGTATALEAILADPARRTGPAGIAAAFALGLLPPDAAASITTNVLTSFLHGSLRRQRDVLLALLLGLAKNEQRSLVAPLRRLFDDESVRDPVVRGRLLTLLLPIDPGFDTAHITKLLQRDDTEERLAVLTWLASGPGPHDDALLDDLTRVATQSQVVEERARALAVLTRMRHPPALEIAARALRSSHAVEAGQGIRSVLAIGGASMRAALDQRIRDERDPHRQAAMIASFDAPASRALVDECVQAAIDTSRPLPLRVAAAHLVTRNEPERLQPLLRDLFRASSAPALLDSLAHDIARGRDLTPITRLLDDGGDLERQAPHWRALLAADHPEAVRQMLAAMTTKEKTSDRCRAAFVLWRQSRVLALPTDSLDAAPEALVRVLGP